MTDQDLLQAYVDSSDVDSLGTFLGRYQESLVRFVSGFLQDDSAAQDIVQETFLRVAKQPKRLLDVARTSIELLSHEMQAVGARVSLEFSADTLCVSGDPTQLQQVALNLLRNAVEAVEHVEVERREIVLRAQPCGSAHLRLTVEDRGTGYPADLELRLFETFVTTKPDGMGLGLAISRSIAESHGGRLWAERRAEGGAAFHLRLPANYLEP